MNNGEIEQHGTPREIYNHPKTIFVANFIGSYNVLTKKVFKENFLHDIDAKEIAIRPEIIRLTKNHNQNNEDYCLKECKVIDISIIGNVIRYKTQKLELFLNIDTINNNLEDIKLWDYVTIYINKKDCIFLTPSHSSSRQTSS